RASPLGPFSSAMIPTGNHRCRPFFVSCRSAGPPPRNGAPICYNLLGLEACTLRVEMGGIKGIAIAILVLTASADALADDAEDCLTSWPSLTLKEGPRVVAACDRLAEGGNAQAQWTLGLMYDLGFGVAVDHGMAAEWLRKAADQGYAPAQELLGELY